MQCPAADPQYPGGFGHIAAAAFQRTGNEVPLGIFQRLRGRMISGTGWNRNFFRISAPFGRNLFPFFRRQKYVIMLYILRKREKGGRIMADKSWKTGQEQSDGIIEGRNAVL